MRRDSVVQPCHFSSFLKFQPCFERFFYSYELSEPCKTSDECSGTSSRGGYRSMMARGRQRRSGNRLVHFFSLFSYHRGNSAKLLQFLLHLASIFSTVHSIRFRVSTEFFAGAVNGRELCGADEGENDWAVHPFSEWLVSAF